MNTLVLVEHDNNTVNDATLAVVTAAGKLGEVTALVAGHNCGSVAEAAAKIAGVSKVLKADDAAYAHALAENVAPLVAGLMAGYDAFLAPATTSGKNIAPRVAAHLDVMQISKSCRSKAPRPSPVRSMRATRSQRLNRPTQSSSSPFAAPLSKRRQPKADLPQSKTLPGRVTQALRASSVRKSPRASVRN